MEKPFLRIGNLYLNISQITSIDQISSHSGDCPTVEVLMSGDSDPYQFYRSEAESLLAWVKDRSIDMKQYSNDNKRS